jgi:hypothetical protein
LIVALSAIKGLKQEISEKESITLKMEARSVKPSCHRSTLRQKMLHCCRYSTSQLLSTNLLTGEQSCYKIPGYQFKGSCLVNQLPGGGLLITGGSEFLNAVKEVVKIDTLREYTVAYQAPMLTARGSHAAVYHSQYLYVLGGYSEFRALRECERYVGVESQWEELPALPVACCAMSAVELDHCIYALGGFAYPTGLDSVQKLSVDSLTWELKQLKLPQASIYFACFKTDTQVYLVIMKTLYSFTPLEIKPILTLSRRVECISSYYSRGTLYYSWSGEVMSLAVGHSL